MIDYIVLKLLLNKSIFNKYNNIIDFNFYKINNREVFKLFTVLFALHEKIDNDLTIEDLSLSFYSSYPMLKPDEKVLFDTILSNVSSQEVNQELALEYLEKHRQQTLSTKIALAALEVSRGKGDLGTIIEMLTNEKPITAAVDDSFITDDLEVLANSVLETEGLRWRLATMNKTLGSLRKGDFGFVFARPETGKTTFLASEVTHMAEQADNPVLWLNNEEQGNKVKTRCYQALFGITQQELFSNLDFYQEEYIKRLGGKIKIKDEARITKKMVETLCEQIQPSLIIIDQIDKIYWADSERYDLKMKAIYQWARELAKTYAPVIAICQAGGTAEGKRYLNMNDVDSSHTAKQGEADFMIGIGKTNSDEEEFHRFISICKNKLSGDTDSIPELRHGKVQIKIIPEIARYEDVNKW